jgi:hypothetical protein
MSGRKIILCLYCLLVPLRAVVWHCESAVFTADPGRNKTALSCVYATDIFPDTVCFGALLSPAYRAYGVREGLLYGGGRHCFFSIYAQYHRLMNNYLIYTAFPVLLQEQVRASLQLDYAYSAVPGFDRKHGLTCSGALRVFPSERWEAAVQSRHFLQLPEQLCDTVTEMAIQAGFSYQPLEFCKVGFSLKKRESYSWQCGLHMHANIRDILYGSFQYVYPEGELVLMLQIRIQRWQVAECMRIHPLLGITHTAGLAYVY